MKILKIETNYKRNLFFSENIPHIKKYSEKMEMNIINIYPQITYQNIIGFGGAFTEATGYCINKLPKEKQEDILNEYFGNSGLNYNICRLPIGSSDFSNKSYSYSNKQDLSDFSIEADKKHIISNLNKAQKINPDLQFLSSPWSPPKFMKSNKLLTLGGKLLEKYKQTWADYLVKYITEYSKENIRIEYLTVQNEPNATQTWESCLYSPQDEIDFVTNYLYPTFQKNNITTKILIWDHNKEKLFTRVTQELTTTPSLNAVSGIAFHWYTGDHFENITLTQKAFPNMILFHTEGCTGYSNFNPNDEIYNAEIYAHDIIGDLNSGINAFLDWNMVLDNNGGPNHKRNYCNSPIMLNKTNTDYIKNLSFYYIGHFTKYIKPNASRIAFSRYTTDIELTAFKNPDNSIVIILLNKNNFNKEYTIILNDISISDNLDSHAIVTYVIN